MKRHEQHVRLRPEHVLRSVSVMSVEVDDHDSLAPRHQLSGSDCDVREQTESHRVGTGGVVPRWPDRAECR